MSSPTSAQVGPVGKTDGPSAKAEPKAADSKPAPDASRTLAEFNRGAALMEQYEYSKAIEAFEKVLGAFPNWTAARFNLGLALLNDQKDLVRAEKELLRVLADEPDNRWAHFCLGVYYQLEPDGNEKALKHFEKVHQADPDDLSAAYHLAVALTGLNRHDEAQKVLESIVERDTGFISAVYRLGNLYNRAHEPAKGAQLFKRFRDLNLQEVTGGSFAIKDPYSAKGKYWMVLDASGLPIKPEPLTPAPRVIFSPEVKTLDVPLKAWTWTGGSVQVPGVAVGDVDGDGDLDLIVCGSGDDGGVVLLLNDGKGQFTAGPKLSDKGVSPMLGDVDNDGDLDLWLGRAGQDLLLLNDGKGNFTPAPKQPGNPDENLSACARLVDLDSDGDLDLLSARLAGGSVPPGEDQHPASSNLFLNKLDGTYDEIAGTLGLAQPEIPLAAIIADDLDVDRDIDLALLPAKGQPILWENFRVGQYRLHEGKDTGLDVDGGAGITTGDPFKTGRRDILISTGKEILLYRARGPWKYERDKDFAAHCGPLGGTSAQFVDIDNDGDLDILIPDAHHSDGTRGPELLVNDWPQPRFVPAAEIDPSNLLTSLETAGVATGVAADFNGDGKCDYLLLAMGQSPRLIENATPGGHWVEVDLAGNRDQEKKSRSPDSAIGARVELRAGTVTQQFVVGVPAGATSMPPLRIHAGLGRETNVQWIRILWPDSVLQAELEKSSDQVIAVTELNRRPSSCPHLFAWDGERFAFISDFGGVGGLGYRIGPNTFAPPDPTEYVRLPRLEPRGEDYTLQVCEPLEEMVYFDEAKLIAVDHPQGTEIYPHEMAAVSAPPPPFEVFCFESDIDPVKVVDHKGRDVTDVLRKSDRLYADSVEPDRRFPGYAKDHHVELDFADRLKDLPANARVILLLDGWVEYSTSTSNYAAGQAGLRLKAPSVSVQREGQWVELAHEVGYPAGINHVMTLDLTGKLRPEDRTIRVASNMDLSWDRIALAVHRGDARVVLQEVPARSADLHFRGFPREFSPDGRKPNLLDYANIDASNTWLKMPGAYTRYGDVTELVQGADDRFVMMASGDEITLKFPASAFGPVPSGFTRTFLLKSDSYCKDMDLYTGGGDRVEPLPFHGMSGYPYGADEHYPETDTTRADRQKYHTRIIAP